jgi:hypothetical protein
MRSPILFLSFSLVSMACSTSDAPTKRPDAQAANGQSSEALQEDSVLPTTPDSPQAEPLIAEDSEQASIAVPEVQADMFIRVRPGENLVSLANWAQTTPTDLAELNGMEVQDTLFAGQKLGFSLEGDALDNFDSEREFASQSRLDHYLESRGGLYTVEGHAMRTGETVWGVAKSNGGLPLWVVGAFNEDLNLDRLAIGDIVTLPVLLDSVQVSLEVEDEEEASVVVEGQGAPW